MTVTENDLKSGRIVGIAGPVVDVEFPPGHLPEINTQLEFDLLRYFAKNPGRTLSRQELQSEVWQLDNYPNTRMVDNFIVRLRRHFEPEPRDPRYFISVRGFGYKFAPDEG